MSIIESKLDKNTLAVSILEFLGITKPAKHQINLIQEILAGVILRQEIFYSNHLTKKEKNCLYWTAIGLSIEEIARLLNVSTSTVVSYRAKIRNKLKTRSMAEAVFKGMRLGYLRSACTLSEIYEQ